MYLAPQNIPRAISVLTLGNKVMLYCIVLILRERSRLRSVSAGVEGGGEFVDNCPSGCFANTRKLP